MILKSQTVKNGKMSLYKANFDFEYSLVNLTNERINDQLEHLFFWTCDVDDTLQSRNHYPASYLKYIESQRGYTPKINSDLNLDSLNWWGDLQNIDRSKALNSNWNFYKWLQTNDLINEEILFHQEQPNKFISNYYYKKDFGFSGKSFLNNNDHNYKKIIQMPVLDRVKDYSIIFNENREMTFLEHNIGKRLNWQSVQLANCSWLEPKKILENWIEDFDPKSVLSLDFFSYNQDGTQKIFYSEINYRKTMGWIFINIQKQFPMVQKIILAQQEPEEFVLALSPRKLKYRVYAI